VETSWDAIQWICAYTLPGLAVAVLIFAVRSKEDLLPYFVCLGLTIVTLVVMAMALLPTSGGFSYAWSYYWDTVNLGLVTRSTWGAVVLSILIVLVKKRVRARG